MIDVIVSSQPRTKRGERCFLPLDFINSLLSYAIAAVVLCIVMKSLEIVELVNKGHLELLGSLSFHRLHRSLKTSARVPSFRAAVF